MTEASPTPEFDTAPDSLSEQLLQEESARRKKRLAIVVVTTTIIVGVATAGILFRSRAADKALAEGYSAAHACLWPGATTSESVGLDLRLRQLRAVHLDLTAKSRDRWPDRCAAPVGAFQVLLREHKKGMAEYDALGEAAEKLAVTLQEPEPVFRDLTDSAKAFLTAAAALNFSAKGASFNPEPPKPAKAFNVDSLSTGSQISPLQYGETTWVTTRDKGGDLHLLLHDRALAPVPTVCAFPESGPATCRRLTGKIAQASGLEFIGHADQGSVPLIGAGRRGHKGLFLAGRPDAIAAGPADEAYVSSSGYVAWLDLKNDGERVLHELAPKTTKARKESLKGLFKGESIHRSYIFWNQLLVQTTKEEGAGQLFALPLGIGAKRQPKLIGALDWVNAKFHGCRSGDSMAVRIGSRYLAFFDGKQWSPPQRSKTPLRGLVTCYPGEVMFTSLGGQQTRCNTSKCERIAPPTNNFEPFGFDKIYVGDLARKPFALLRAKKFMGLRLATGTTDQLSKRGVDRAIFDDHFENGKHVEASTVLSMRLYPMGSHAVILLGTPKGIFALRVDGKGAVTPAQIDFAR